MGLSQLIQCLRLVTKAYGTLRLTLVKFFQVTANVVDIYSLKLALFESYLAPLDIVPKVIGLMNRASDPTKWVVEVLFTRGGVGVGGNV